MVSCESQKIYNRYINAYEKWCQKTQKSKENSLDSYREYLKDKNKSSGYIRNCINTISKKCYIPTTNNASLSREKLTVEEWTQLKNFCQHNYQRNELSLLLLLIMETGLKIKTILALTKSDVENVIVNQEFVYKRPIPKHALYIFEYLLTLSYQIKADEHMFRKKYHTYLYAFKKCQQYLFPSKQYISFNGLYKKT